MIWFHAFSYGSIYGPIPTIQINAYPYATIQILCEQDGCVKLGELIKSIYFLYPVILQNLMFSPAWRSKGKLEGLAAFLRAAGTENFDTFRRI